MKNLKLSAILLLLFLFKNTSSQGFLMTQPRAIYDGTQLMIFYDILTNKPDDYFYVWVEMKKISGDLIEAKNLSGDIGDNIKSGNSKKIIWYPEKDSIYLDEDVLVEVKAEKYEKSFNKGTMIMRSMVFPGWGQTKISKGKPWWLSGLIFYGAMAGGYFYYHNYLKSYESYRIEDDELKRADFLHLAQQQVNYSLAFAYSGAAIWSVNVFWVMATPNRYQLLHHGNISLKSSAVPYSVTPLLTLTFEF